MTHNDQKVNNLHISWAARSHHQTIKIKLLLFHNKRNQINKEGYLFGGSEAYKLKNSDFTTSGASPDSDKLRQIQMRKSLSFWTLNVLFLKLFLVIFLFLSLFLSMEIFSVLGKKTMSKKISLKTWKKGSIYREK